MRGEPTLYPWVRRHTQRCSLESFRKMCAVIQHHPGKGGPLRASRCIPPDLWHDPGIEPAPCQQTVSPVNHSRETSLSVHPSTWRAFLPHDPRPHEDQPLADWMPPSCRRWLKVKRVSALSNAEHPASTQARKRTLNACIHWIHSAHERRWPQNTDAARVAGAIRRRLQSRRQTCRTSAARIHARVCEQAK